MTEPAAAAVVSDPARAAEAQAALRQLLRLVNILSGSLPGPNMGRDATRDVLIPRLHAVEVSIVAAGGATLLASRCTAERDFFEADASEVTPAAGPTSTATITTSATPGAVAVPTTPGTAPVTTTVMGAPASMADRSSLAADALARAEEQSLSIITWGAGHAGELAVWWVAFEQSVRSLIDGVSSRARALRDVVTGAGRQLRDFFAAWAIQAQQRFDALVTALGIGAGLGAAGGILFLAFLLMMAVRNHT